MTITSLREIEELDVEWVDLILTARNMGLSIEEIRAFLKSSGDYRADQSASRR